MENRIRISVVNYTNSRPFIYGLRNAAEDLQAEIAYDIPADCAQKLIDDQVDIGLVPVATLLSLDYWEIISAFCIGASGPVNSVFIFSEKPIDSIKRLQLDPQSRSSNMLARVLLKNHWKTAPELLVDAPDYALPGDDETAFVQIGDRTFGKQDQYAYAYDLAEEWQKMTGLPFVFAAWVANKPVEDQFKDAFTDALRYGLDHRAEVIASLPAVPGFDIETYLMHNIDYILDAEKRKALELYLKLARELEPLEHEIDRR
ncbi:MAG: menaquinone biosynthesis protein [Mucilaginibacter polytrichastri]|nr:menaquinone biosynthesis protein [Mucilaginibacter polytrichastri]